MVKRRRWLSPFLLTLSILPTTQTQAVVTEGTASYYADRFNGRKTASGARFNTNALTAAHKTLSFGTKVMVTNKANGRSVEVTINDRGPYAHGRMIDLSKGAAREIGMLGSGTARVELQVVEAANESSFSRSGIPTDVAQTMMMELF
ncbi:septal ring lytic transglycosylase RlpA family lipoprotein [Thiocystis minor]|uniref:septal ring lytic transglycosylase RlpA family protein n=1 Tax=Thiocystis minor TaxID=61597 RepID=UPI001914CCAA|nr:septal ring lytic transglycosylase RlpA family protein [Thiocystis minor]MBK5964078.1 septal ring lytic transglycosylase RlpA family lipoprotein [Thiocystis minor]